MTQSTLYWQDATGNMVCNVTDPGGVALASVPVVEGPAYEVDEGHTDWATSLGSYLLVG